MLKIALLLVKNVFFGLKKGISELMSWVAAKATAQGSFPLQFLIHFLAISV